MIETMRSLLLFETLSDEQLQWLAEHASEVTFAAGELIFSEGKPADALWVLIAGEWRLSRQIGGFETPLVTTAQPGTWGGGMPVAGGIHQISARATRPSRMLRIPDAAVKHMLDSGFPITRHLLAGITIGARRLEALQSEHEKLTALGKLAAGLAHELNNPAAAARRAGAGLRQVLRDQQDAVLALAPADVAERWRARLASVRDEIAAAIEAAQPVSPLERSEREDAIAAWLDDHEVPEGYDAAPTLVDAGLDVDWLERLAEHAPPEALPDLIRWVVVTAMGLLLGDQLEHSTTRISELIGAVKSYSYMDEAPLQEVDIHEGLENTLMMLGHEIKGGIVVIREYDRGLPHITAYGSELNQVWTNLIDNAIDAMGGRGHLTIRTALDCDNVLVEIADDGPGIPAEVVPHIFEPFFTTKGVGEGTGLGLEIAYRIVVERHHGNIQVASQPGNTCFQVRLPIRSSS